MNANKRDIVRGPSRETLWLSALYVYDQDKGIPITFRVLRGEAADSESDYIKMRDVKVQAVGHGNKSGYKLILNGTCEADIVEDNNFTTCSFRAYYDAKTRKGEITFTW